MSSIPISGFASRSVSYGLSVGPAPSRGELRVYPPTQRPETYYLLGEVAPNWRVVRPLVLRVERDELGNYLASDDQFMPYGVGPTRADAIRDYIESLIEYFELIEQESRSDEPTRAHFRGIRRVISRVAP